MDIPRPDKLESDFDIENNYHRYSVAYGLSHDSFDLGQCIEQQIEDIAEPNLSHKVIQGQVNRASLYKS